jgi:hypothetical protein
VSVGFDLLTLKLFVAIVEEQSIAKAAAFLQFGIGRTGVSLAFGPVVTMAYAVAHISGGPKRRSRSPVSSRGLREASTSGAGLGRCRGGDRRHFVHELRLSGGSRDDRQRAECDEEPILRPFAFHAVDPALPSQQDWPAVSHG